jgi:magnesium transporter
LLTFHDARSGRVVSCALDAVSLPAELNWIDALAPDDAELAFLRLTLNVEAPTLQKMSEIETSSRLYRAGDNLYLTVTVATRHDDGTSHSTPLAFVVTRDVLLTVRYEPVRICEAAQTGTLTSDRPLAGGAGALIVLLEALVDHIADDLEIVTARLDQHSQAIFTDQPAGRLGRPNDGDRSLRHVLILVGQLRGFTSRISETLLVVTRLTRYVAAEAADRLDKEAKFRLGRLARDALSLNEHETRLSDKVQFLLDATLGLISVEQNDIFKILTMVSVVGIPPTLVASMYGMNFKSMPELDWPYGYEYGLFLIFTSAVIPLLWFKWRHWW